MQTKPIRRSGPLLFIAIMALCLPMIAQATEPHCEPGVGSRRSSTPTNGFVPYGDGVVLHTKTRLQWSQCSLGQTRTHEGCDGQATALSWNAAMLALSELNASGALGGYSDWRLPTAKELMTIVERCRQAPAINTEVFPNTPRAGYWTSTLRNNGRGNPVFVGFHLGREYDYRTDANYRLRPVRSPSR